jgi:hypothetical protein
MLGITERTQPVDFRGGCLSYRKPSTAGSKRIWHIDLPGIMPVTITLLVLYLGSILNYGFEKVMLMQNNVNLGVSEVIDTDVYRIGLLSSIRSSPTRPPSVCSSRCSRRGSCSSPTRSLAASPSRVSGRDSCRAGDS